MTKRAYPSGIKLCAYDASLIKGMLVRGDRQHDIAAWFRVNGGRIAEIGTGYRFKDVEAAVEASLPPAGPYPKASQALEAIHALTRAQAALSIAEKTIRQISH